MLLSNPHRDIHICHFTGGTLEGKGDNTDITEDTQGGESDNSNYVDSNEFKGTEGRNSTTRKQQQTRASSDGKDDTEKGGR